jgi:hypothetical protein
MRLGRWLPMGGRSISGLRRCDCDIEGVSLWMG